MPIAGETQLIADAITDEVGSNIPNPPSGNDLWALTKSGAGTLVLSGTNGYAGLTTVSGGILRVTSDNTSSSGTSVAAGATLTGDGSIKYLDDFGTLAPGTSTNSTGILQVYGLIFLEGGALSCFHADAVGNSSRLLVTPYINQLLDGTATLAGLARIDFKGSPLPGAQYLLVSAGIIGTFSGFETNVAGLVGQLNYSPSQVTFSVTANETIYGNGFEEPSASQSACAAAFAH